MKESNKNGVVKQKYFHNAGYISNTGTIRRKKSVHDAVEHVVNTYLTIKDKNQLKDAAVLDVGSGIGEYSFEIAKYTKKVVGVEPYRYAYERSMENLKRFKYKNKLTFKNLLVEDFRTKQRFDLIVSITTIEHMPNALNSFRHIFKLMKPGGVIYLTAPNKLWPIECHYGLPFLSYLPSKLADMYVKVSGKGKDYRDSAYSKTYFGMKNFFDNFNCTYKFILPDPNSSYLGCGKNEPIYNFVKKTGIELIKRFSIFWLFSKGFIMVITKN